MGSPLKPNRLRAWLAISTLALAVVMDAVYSTSLLIERFFLPDGTMEVDDMTRLALFYALMLAWAAAAYLAATIVAAVAFLVWLYRAVDNAHVVGRWRLRTTPASAVWCWFIPILNLFRPYQVVKVLYRTSEPSNRNLEGDWIRRAPVILPLWWAMWLIQSFIGNGVAKLNLAASSGALDAGMWLQLLALPFGVISAILAAAVLWSIQVRQEARVLEPATAYRLREGDSDAADEDEASDE